MAREPSVMDYHPDETTAPAAPPQRRTRSPVIPWEACHPVGPQGAVIITAGAGTFLQPDMMGPTTAYWWDLRKFSAWGFTAGTVTVFKNIVNGEPVTVLNAPGLTTWSTSEMLAPDDNLIVVAAGITGQVQFSLRAIEIQSAWVPEYLL